MRLAVDHAQQEMQAISCAARFASTIHRRLAPNARPENYCDLPGSEESVKHARARTFFDDFAIADRLLDGCPSFFDRFTAVDAYFFWCFRRAGTFNLDLSRFCSRAAHFARIAARASVQRVLAHEREGEAAFAAA
jgi:glutathione S-transferase